MRRLLRILLSTATVISLLVAIATAALWVRSYSTSDELTYYTLKHAERGTSWARIHPDGGVLYISFHRMIFDDQELFDRRDPKHPSYQKLRDEPPQGLSYSASRRWPPAVEESFWRRRGFRFDWSNWFHFPPARARMALGTLNVPFWVFILLFILLPLSYLLRRVRARRRVRLGLCPICGYDLRASSNKCPECGTIRAGATA